MQVSLLVFILQEGSQNAISHEGKTTLCHCVGLSFIKVFISPLLPSLPLPHTLIFLECFMEAFINNWTYSF